MNSKASRIFRQASFMGAITAITWLPAVHADDIEALVSAPKEANILFVLDVSGSMGWDVPGGGNQGDRLDQMKAAITTIIDSQTTNPNIGFTYFGGSSGSGIKWPISPLDGEAHNLDPDIPRGTSNGQVIKYMANALSARGSTPSTDAMYEATLYFRGASPHYGSRDTFGTWNTHTHPPQYTGGNSTGYYNRPDGQRAANPITLTGVDPETYHSPIGECQANAIIFLSDGAPTRNNSNSLAETLIADATGVNSYSCMSTSGLPSRGRCAPDLAKFLYENDQIRDIAGSNVRTYSIGFHVDQDGSASRFLQTLASEGGGTAYSADNSASLVSAINSILEDVAKDGRTFSGVSTSISPNTLKTSNKTFLALFQPTQHAAWEGNVKGYFLRAGVLVDLSGDVATESTTSGIIFKEGAQSFWSTEADGADIGLGGLKNTLGQGTRSLYVITDPDESDDILLSDGSHNLSTSNPDFATQSRRSAAQLLGLPANARYTDVRNLINWMRSSRMGDPLHSAPVMIDYGGETGQVLFASTNQGFLHAFNVNHPTAINDLTGGTELFAFMPYENLSKQHRAQSNPISDNHVYGIDGELKFWVRDLNSDGIINHSDKVYLFFGMRRGGNVYYGMDVTDPTAPRVMWKIKAGSAGFEKLGQTWSAPAIVNLENGGTDKTALIFGGGYDTAEDIRAQARNSDGDSKGMGIYIIDPLTGDLLNSIGYNSDFLTQVPEMKYAVPSEIRVIDTDTDGYADRMYFGDMGGNLWRVDIDNDIQITDASALSGYKLAYLSGASASENRRFYYPPAVAYTWHNGSKKLAVAIGSGYRAHPLDNTISDRMHVVFDDDIETRAPATTPSAITETSLEDLTENLIQEGNSAAARTAAIAALNAAKGWRIDLSSGEKSLSSPIIFENKLLFTTFSQGESVLCGLKTTSNRYYAINLEDATPLESLHNPETGNHKRSVILKDKTNTIAPAPQVIYYEKNIDPDNSDKGKQGCAGFMTGLSANSESCADPKKIYWKETQ